MSCHSSTMQTVLYNKTCHMKNSRLDVLQGHGTAGARAAINTLKVIYFADQYITHRPLL